MIRRLSSPLASPLLLTLLPALCAALLAGCAATPPEPDYVPPVPAGYADTTTTPTADWSRTAAAAPRTDGAWWRAFGDARLDALEAEVPVGNASLASQLAAYEQAQAALAQAQAAYAPTVTANASAQRSRSQSGSAAGAVIGNGVTATLGATWAPDLWGRVRLQVRAGEAGAAAAAASLQGTLLSLQGTLAQSYLQLRVVDAQIRLARATVDDDARALELTRHRYEAGVATVADVALARTQLLQAQTSLTDLDVTRTQLVNAIAVLVGRAPADFRLEPDADLPTLPALPPGLPAQLLQRRPDLAAARAKVEQANAQIGVARTAWFPNLTLGAQYGSQAARIGELFSAPSLFWSLGPQLAATLFDGGARSAQLDVTRAQYRQAVADYRQAALTALQQVDDNLTAQRVLAHEAEQQAAVVEAAEVSLRLARSQYQAGTAPYLNVLSAQNTASSARNAELTLRNRRYAAAVALIQALGGGWGDAPVVTPRAAASAVAGQARAGAAAP